VFVLAVLLSVLVGASTAAAAPELTIPLDPPELLVYLAPVENEGALDPADPDSFVPWDEVAVEWGGSAVLQLPAEVDAGAMDVVLDLAPSLEDDSTRTYSSTSAAPNDLTVTPLGGGQYRVTLPADDLTNGPFGYLTFDGLAPAAGGNVSVLPLTYMLEFTGTGVSARSLTTQLVAIGSASCPMSSGERCPAYPVTAGSSFALTVPAGSPLRALGLGSLASLQAVLLPVDGDGIPTDDEPIDLTAAAARAAATTPPADGLPQVLEGLAGAATGPGGDGAAPTVAAAVTATGPYNALVTLPADLRPGQYSLSLLEGSTAAVSIIGVELAVPAAPVAPAVPQVAGNAGLRSDTGWTEPPADGAGGPASALVALGAGMLLAAGTCAGLVLRAGRKARRAGAACAD
jgi:hypothetical protein